MQDKMIFATKHHLWGKNILDYGATKHCGFLCCNLASNHNAYFQFNFKCKIEDASYQANAA